VGNLIPYTMIQQGDKYRDIVVTVLVVASPRNISVRLIQLSLETQEFVTNLCDPHIQNDLRSRAFIMCLLEKRHAAHS